MNMKQSLKLAVLLVPLLATAALAGVYCEQELKTPTQTMKTVAYISGAKMRTETQTPAGPMITIMRVDQGKMYHLVPQEKTYMEMPILKRSPEEEAQVQVTVTKTGETKKIGDYNCTRYDVTTKGMPNMPPEGMTMQSWVTTDVDVVDEYAKFIEAQSSAQPSKTATEMAKIKGFPIQQVMDSPMGKTTVTVTAVKKQDVPDSMFEVPADYTKTAMPAMPGMPSSGAKPPVAPPAAGGAAQ